jgi:hypothetical protein
MPRHSLDDCYRLLELRPGASMEEVREAYRVLSRVWHPDRFAGTPAMQQRATARQQELNDAYRELMAALTSGRTADAASAAAAPDGGGPPPGAVAAEGGAAGAPRHAGPRTAPVRQRFGRRSVLGGVAALLTAAVLAALGLARTDGVVHAADGRALSAHAVAAGGEAACAAVGPTVWCWPAGEQGPPAMVALPDSVISLAGGLLHACALLRDGAAWCWGGNFAGQLGSGGSRDRREPGRVAFNGSFAALSALGRHTCGLTAGGSLHCWGDDGDGQLGIGRPVASCRIDAVRFYCSDRPEPVGRAGQWRAVAAGGSHTCAIDGGGGLHCWGSDRFGQLGSGSTGSCDGVGGPAPCRRAPARVTTLAFPAAAVVAGASHTCVLDADGRAWCWGLNTQRQTGSAASDIVVEPTPVATPLRFVRLAAGAYHTCGVTAAGSLHCWGSDAAGELRGRGEGACAEGRCTSRPLRLAAGVREAAAGFGVTCAARPDGRVRCWGRGDAGREPVGRAAADRVASSIPATARAAAATARRTFTRLLVQPLEQAR